MSVTIDSLVHTNQADLVSLEERLCHSFADVSHLQKALIHSSFAFEHGKTLKKDNETLEFLGDAVLDLTVGYALFQHFPDMKEGELTKLRAALVNERHLAHMARKIDLGVCLLLGRGEEVSRGREKSSILACAYEAVVGAIFLDGGYGAATAFVEKHFVPYFAKSQETLLLADAKSSLQERLQEIFSEGPQYVVERDEGPDHDKTFYISVRFREQVLGQGSARSKKEAEQLAAAEAVKNFASFGFEKP